MWQYLQTHDGSSGRPPQQGQYRLGGERIDDSYLQIHWIELIEVGSGITIPPCSPDNQNPMTHTR